MKSAYGYPILKGRRTSTTNEKSNPNTKSCSAGIKDLLKKEQGKWSTKMASASLPVDHNVKADLVKARQDPAAVETLLASELHQMSIDEREKVYEEIHGVAEQDDEAPEMLAESLEELEVEIQKIKDRAAYEKGLQASPDYVTGRRFRLMFLRAKNFDAKSAAASLVIFMEEKLKYFGPESLGRPIHLSDLDRDDLAVLKSGSNQVLAARDRSGRAVFFDPNLIVNFPYKNVLNVVSTEMCSCH